MSILNKQTSIQKKQRVEEIGKELYADGGSDAMENMFYSIEFKIKEEIKKDAKPYRSCGIIYLNSGNINTSLGQICQEG